MIRELKTFVAVSRYGTLAKTATRIGLTQSAISAQIRRLEDEFGFELFDRSGRASRLTGAGERTLERAEELLALYGRIGEPEAQYADVGSIRIGAIASAQASYLVEVLVDFRAKLPGWNVRVVPGVSFDFLAQVDTGEIDLAIMIRPPFALSTDLSWTTLLKEPYVLICPSSMRGKDWRKILGSEPFIRYDRQSFGGRAVDRFLKQQKITVRDAFELDDLPIIHDLVNRGAGVAIVPANYLVAMTSAVVAIGIDTALYREIGLLRRYEEGVDNSCGLMARLIAERASAGSERNPK